MKLVCPIGEYARNSYMHIKYKCICCRNVNTLCSISILFVNIEKKYENILLPPFKTRSFKPWAKLIITIKTFGE